MLLMVLTFAVPGQPITAQDQIPAGLTVKIPAGLTVNIPAGLTVNIPAGLTVEHQAKTSRGCISCHTSTDAATMHKNPAVVIGCADCHGGDSSIMKGPAAPGSLEYDQKKQQAHILPKDPSFWSSSANPQHSYAKLLKEPAEFVRFINPGDLRVASEACGGCHAKTVDAVKKSLMTTSAMLWGGASYNNNILPFKRYVLGESYSKDGLPQKVLAEGAGDSAAQNSAVGDEQRLKKGELDQLLPLPQWEVTEPGDIFRVFERGGLNIRSQFPEIGNPNPQEEAGKPDIRSSNRGRGTGSRVSIPVLNIHKTRLNDPHLSFLGTNDHPGDYRSSGCTGCHVVYANDRDPLHSADYGKHGNTGKSITEDPTIPKDESGHPLKHEFTRAIPTSQCMVCHMHQPNMFVNSYLGYTMWDYEADAPFMWPKQQRYPSDKELFEAQYKNPEGAAARGLWSNEEFLRDVSKLNPKLKDTQFADYHGHGWNFRAIFKRDRRGNLLDKDGNQVSSSDPDKFKKAVHLKDIHLEKGMHCSDCHFGGDSHGNGKIYGEVAQAVEIGCIDCHGTVNQRADLKTSGPAAPEGGTDLGLKRTPFGKELFIWKGDELYQRSMVTEGLEWKVKQVRDSIDPKSGSYNPQSAKAKTVLKFGATDQEIRYGDLATIDTAHKAPQALDQGKVQNTAILAHGEEKVSCYTCHSSWVTSCGGCHLPIEANWKKESNHYDGKTSRNWASYNPQVVRDEMFQLGVHGPAKDNRIVPVRSSSALILSSTDINRQKIYVQQPPISAAGFSSQAFAPHFPHTVRTKETKQCSDCHISKDNDNNAIMAQLLLLGTNFVNFMGYHTYVATGTDGVEAVQVTEWEEPQAVIGSYLHKYAYPDFYQRHQDRAKELQTSHHHASEGGAVNAIQLRGEYLFTTASRDGFRVFDVASVSNKGFSERMVTAPVSPLGQDTHVSTKAATSFVLPTTMPIAPDRKPLPENLEQPMHPIYHYALITDAEEGLILVNVDTLADGDPENNFLERALTWNPDGLLTGARTIALSGHHALIGKDDSIVVVDLNDPLSPKHLSTIEIKAPSGIAIQFRYAFVTNAQGFHVLDISNISQPRWVKSATVELADARNVYVARTYAYIAGGKDGLVIVDIERPEHPRIYQRYSAEGAINDLYDVKIATTNASLFAYLADGANGLKVVQLTDPERTPNFYGFSPEVKPLLIAQRKTDGPATAISKPLDRDRAVDEDGNQVSVFGRIGSRPFNLEEMRKLWIRPDGGIYTVD